MIEGTPMTPEDIASWSRSWSFVDPKAFMQMKETVVATGNGGVTKTSTNVAVTGNGHDTTVSVHLKETSRLQLPSGEQSIVADLGSWINVIGSNTAKEFEAEAAKHGQKTTYAKKSKTLNLTGVGSDSAPCKVEASMPIAVQFEENPATIETFHANVAEGCGSNLPAIMGCKSMQDKDAVIVLRKGKEMMVFPGPGGYKIEWSPGTKLLPMHSAPSGHMLIPCGKFQDVSKSKNPKGEVMFWTDHSKATGSSY